ncbi:uncharacterized protein [Epargyreus clarus]|uniref:uncharacterized protein isoform X2 n=1 Tax=Epargyreus clarus TaxID=520877 RepID=UPI003C2FB42B
MTMSSMRYRFIFRNFGVVKLWNVWYRNYLVNSVVRRCRERGVREVLQCFKYAIRPRRTFLLATAAFKNREDDDSTFKCDQGITDDELEALLSELQNVQDLAKMTLYCTSCGKRLVIDRKHNGVCYCMCKEPQCEESPDGWVPYMEAEDVIIWRKEYKPGQGLYAYKVYGRYPEVNARDFAAVQVDGAYRCAWDAAVAALAVVQRRVAGVPDQAVLHWEVLWPRLFANRDYVYIRRHKEFETNGAPVDNDTLPTYFETSSVHAKAKRKSLEMYARERDARVPKDRVFVIVSRSCEHPAVPETPRAVRVLEYWSHMLVKTLHGVDKPGMEFVLTYYDEPAVGGLPGGVAAWASGRAAPAYLARMRRAAADYRAWAAGRHQELPEFIPMEAGQTSAEDAVILSEQDMESSKQGPELEETKDHAQTNHDTLNKEATIKTDDVKRKDNMEQNTITEQNSTEVNAKEDSVKEDNLKADSVVNKEVNVKEDNISKAESVNDKVGEEAKVNETEDSKVVTVKKKTEKVQKETSETKETSQTQEEDSDKPEEEENNGGWWRYLYPFYYFV